VVLTPSRLAIARKRRGLTLTRLAELTGLSRHSLSVYENGHQAPSEETLVVLAGALGITQAFLAGPDVEEIPPDAVSFRALSKMTARQRDRALSAGRVALLIDDWIDARFKLPAADIPSLTGYAPESAAEVVRARWGLGERPVSNMLHLLEARGVRIYSLIAENNELDAYSLLWHARPFIFLSTAKSGERGRFDAAHELGHLVLHGEYQELNRPAAKQEANRFASFVSRSPRAAVLDKVGGCVSVSWWMRTTCITPAGSCVAAARPAGGGWMSVPWPRRSSRSSPSYGRARRFSAWSTARPGSRAPPIPVVPLIRTYT